MFNNIISMFSFDFVQRAFIGGLLISLCCAILGVTLVLKRFSMIGDGLSHIAFGAIAIATVIGISPMNLTIPVVIIASILLLRLKNNSKIKGDSAIAMISVSSLAIGVLLISKTSGGNTDIYNYMFGSILALTNKDILSIILLSSIILIMYICSYNKIFTVTFDEKFAKSIGINPEFYNIMIAILSAFTIVSGMKMMGSMLISALIIFPALTSMRIFSTYNKVVISSLIIAFITFCIGMIMSIFLNLPTGATIVTINIFVFLFFSLIINFTKN